MKPSLALRFWLRALDMMVSAGMFGSPLYLWSVRRAANSCPNAKKHRTTREKRT